MIIGLPYQATSSVPVPEAASTSLADSISVRRSESSTKTFKTFVLAEILLSSTRFISKPALFVILSIVSITPFQAAMDTVTGP